MTAPGGQVGMGFGPVTCRRRRGELRFEIPQVREAAMPFVDVAAAAASVAFATDRVTARTSALQSAAWA